MEQDTVLRQVIRADLDFQKALDRSRMWRRHCADLGIGSSLLFLLGAGMFLCWHGTLWFSVPVTGVSSFLYWRSRTWYLNAVIETEKAFARYRAILVEGLEKTDSAIEDLKDFEVPEEDSGEDGGPEVDDSLP